MHESGSSPSIPRLLSRRWSQGRRIILRRRRLVAALLTGGAALAAVHVWAPPSPPTAPIVVAAHDLPGGEVLVADDLTVRRVDPGDVPAGAATSLAEVVGQSLAGPMRSGEMFTDRRVVGPGLLSGYGAGLEAMPLRVSDADAVRLLQVGDQVDVLAATGRAAGDAESVATDVTVVALPPPSDQSRDGALIVLALPPSVVSRLAQAMATTQLTVAVRG